MNAYLFLTQKNVHINNIPPRLMWNIDNNNWNSSASGYCGETSILSAGLLYGQYVPMYMIRQVLADYFNSLWGDDPATPLPALKALWKDYFGVGWKQKGAPGKDYPGGAENFQTWFQKNGQYYCQVLPQIWNKGGNNSGFGVIDTILKNLHLGVDHFQRKEQDTKKNFIPWMKQHVVSGHPVTIGVQDFMDGSGDPDFDHIVSVIGWGSNHDLSDTHYFSDDEIVFSDHGLMVCGQQPHGGAIPYYFRYIMETEDSIDATGGWLPDGGCPDPDNPAWNFIMDLGQYRNLNAQDVPCSEKEAAYTCNAYQLAQSPSTQGSSGNAGFAITGLSDTLPQGVMVRIDTDRYYVVPCITTHQAKNGVQPACTQTMNHKITVSGLNADTDYNVWLFTAKNTGELSQIPHSGFNAYGNKIGAVCYKVSGQSNAEYNYALSADVALLVRCVEATNQ